MPPGRKKRKNKHQYYIHLEPICECMVCGNEHLRRQRRKVVPTDESKFLSISVCPKCGGEGYTLIGDHEVRRKEKDVY